MCISNFKFHKKSFISLPQAIFSICTRKMLPLLVKIFMRLKNTYFVTHCNPLKIDDIIPRIRSALSWHIGCIALSKFFL